MYTTLEPIIEPIISVCQKVISISGLMGAKAQIICKSRVSKLKMIPNKSRFLSRPFMNKENGPRIEPCGVPYKPSKCVSYIN